VLTALLAQSCRCQDGTPPAPTGGSSAKPITERTTLDIALPRLSGKPPAKTTAPLSKASFDKLTALEFADFRREATPYPTSLALRQRTETRPRVSINVHVMPCGGTEKCLPMNVDAWRGDIARLKELTLAPALHDRPDTVFDVGTSSIGGVPVIAVYQVGQFFGTDHNNNPARAYSHAYSLYWNDGVNALRVIASYSDDPRPTVDEMKSSVPRAFLEKAATAFLDAYGQAWAN
jgi:hypothetical protein